MTSIALRLVAPLVLVLTVVPGCSRRNAEPVLADPPSLDPAVVEALLAQAREAEAPAAATGPFAPLAEFAAFSPDSARFAYFSASASGSVDTASVWTSSVGATDAEIYEMVFASEPDGVAALRARLRTEGFDTTQRPVPPGLTMHANLTATPPTVTLRTDGRQTTHAIEQAPFPPTDRAELWGISPDGRKVAIYVHGPQVDGLLTRAGVETVRFFRVVAMP